MVIDYKECPPYLRAFISYLRNIKARSERTISSYYFDLRMFFRYLMWTTEDIPDKTPFDEISIKELPFETVRDVTVGTIYEFIDFAALDMKNSPRSRARKLSALKTFYKALCNGKIQGYDSKNNPTEFAEAPSIKKGVPKYLGLEESRALLANIPDDSSNDYLRDYCIITLFVNCGMRLSELVGLNIQDINFRENTMRLLGKGNKERIIHINHACRDVIEQYLEVRPQCDAEPDALFISKQGRRISNRRVQQIVENALKACNLDKRGLSTHKLRHTAATLMYQYGNVDTLVLKEVLGHASTVTTEIYTHLANDNVRAALDSNPLADETAKKKTDKTDNKK